MRETKPLQAVEIPTGVPTLNPRDNPVSTTTRQNVAPTTSPSDNPKAGSDHSFFKDDD
jgi:hypothetical protein